MEAHSSNEPLGAYAILVTSAFLRRHVANFLSVIFFRRRRGCRLILRAVGAQVYNLFNKAEKNRDDDGGFEGLAEDYEKNGDGKHVMSHGGRRVKGQVVPGESVLGEGSQYKALTNWWSV